uniref:Uncharacterized protein n=1 Tax=Romanomermis culicivorax TaxID=13658 RepID=A0A915JCW2_ROMCU
MKTEKQTRTGRQGDTGANERAVQFCVVDIQATVDHPLYYRCTQLHAPILSAVTSNWLNLFCTANPMDIL